MAGYHGITAGYLIRSDRPCLVETGTASSAPVVRDALTALGVGPRDLSTVVVTHIHLDHAGGVGDIAQLFPAARVVVHTKGARHLADPSRLMASARMYVGDAAGMYLPETGDLRAGTPPPDFDLATALNSVALFGALRPQRLLFSHYGPVGDVPETLERSAEEIKVWVEETRKAHREGLDLDHAVALVHERTKNRYAGLQPGGDEYAGEKLMRLANTEANVAGITHWLEHSDS
jgi:glyoxylase-like metal-dependent hydrolase (beta-lactamase superfamily II)